MKERDQGRLSYLSIAIINIPNQYRKLIKIVRDNDCEPELDRALDILTETVKESLTVSKTKTRKRLSQAARHLIDFGSADEQEVGRALAWAFENYNLQSKPRSE